MEQIEWADLLVLNKAERLTPDARARLRQRLHDLNPSAEIIETSFGQVAAAPRLLDERRFDPARTGRSAAWHVAFSANEERARRRGGCGRSEGHLLLFSRWNRSAPLRSAPQPRWRPGRPLSTSRRTTVNSASRPSSFSTPAAPCGNVLFSSCCARASLASSAQRVFIGQIASRSEWASSP